MNDNNQPWSNRPWILSIFLSLSGLIIYCIFENVLFSQMDTALRNTLATFVFVFSFVFAFSLEQIRFRWILGFSLLWGLILALVVYSTSLEPLTHFFNAGYPFLSGFLSASIALPFFQTIRHYGRLTLPYQDLQKCLERCYMLLFQLVICIFKHGFGLFVIRII